VVVIDRKDLGCDGLFGGPEGVICHLHVTRRSITLVEDNKKIMLKL